MKKLLLILILTVEVSTFAQNPVSLEEAVNDFPRYLLRIENDGPVSLEVDQGTRAAYEALADLAGLNLVLDPDLQDSSSVPFQIETSNILQAFDFLSSCTGTFVEVLNDRTIVVAPEDPAKRRDYELQVIKTFYFPASSSLTDVITTLRTTLQSRFLAQNTTANAIILRDTPNRLVLAEQIIELSARAIAGASAAAHGESLTGGGPI